MPECDAAELRRQLERLVAQLASESAPYIEQRPRFAHAVLVRADDRDGELIKVSCIRPLDEVSSEQRRAGACHASDEAAAASDAEDEATAASAPLARDPQLPFLPLNHFAQRPSQSEMPAAAATSAYDEASASHDVAANEQHARATSPVYVRHETKSKTLEQFPSAPNGTTIIERYRSVRSEITRFAEPHSPRLRTTTTHKTTTTMTTTDGEGAHEAGGASTAAAGDDPIGTAVRILQASCDMLDHLPSLLKSS